MKTSEVEKALHTALATIGKMSFSQLYHFNRELTGTLDGISAYSKVVAGIDSGEYGLKLRFKDGSEFKITIEKLP